MSSRSQYLPARLGREGSGQAKGALSHEGVDGEGRARSGDDKQAVEGQASSQRRLSYHCLQEAAAMRKARFKKGRSTNNGRS